MMSKNKLISIPKEIKEKSKKEPRSQTQKAIALRERLCGLVVNYVDHCQGINLLEEEDFDDLETLVDDILKEKVERYV